MKKPIFSHSRADEVGVAIHSINLESTFEKVDSGIAPILNEPAKDSRISKNFVLWITKEAAASPCFAETLLAQCLASERKRVLFEKWILGKAKS